MTTYDIFQGLSLYLTRAQVEDLKLCFELKKQPLQMCISVSRIATEREDDRHTDKLNQLLAQLLKNFYKKI